MSSSEKQTTAYMPLKFWCMLRVPKPMTTAYLQPSGLGSLSISYCSCYFLPRASARHGSLLIAVRAFEIDCKKTGDPISFSLEPACFLLEGAPCPTLAIKAGFKHLSPEKAAAGTESCAMSDKISSDSAHLAMKSARAEQTAVKS